MLVKCCNKCGRGDRRRMTTQRGYGYQHQRRRAEMLPVAYGKPCAVCGQPMTADQKLDLDHSISVMLGGIGDRIVHARCNRGRPPG